MKVLVRHMLKKTRAGGYAQRDEILSANVVRFGRGADCEIHLPDPRILLHHVELTSRPGGLFLESVGRTDFQLNGKMAAAATVKPGDEIHVGPYDIIILENEDGSEAAFSLEYTRPLGDELGALKERSDVTLTRAGFGIRGWAWMMFLAAIIIGLVGPLAAYFTKTHGGDPMSVVQTSPVAGADQVWLSGPMAGVHAHFGSKCETCHIKPFEQVTAQACVACHSDAGHHADPVQFPVASLTGLNCEQCHKEHTDGEDLMITGETFCVSCHTQMTTIAADSDLKEVSGFETHPEFHPTIIKSVQPLTFERVSMADKENLVDRTGLKFTHKKHLVPEGMRSPDGGRTVLTCSNCHKTETGGVSMLPVNYDDNCSGCHALRFESETPDRVMPHGNVALAKMFVEDTYATLALRGGYDNKDGEDAPAVVRRLVGTPMTDENRMEALEWAESKAADVLDGKFGRGLCAQCHTVIDGATDRDWSVQPVTLLTRWLPKGYFTHEAHKDRDCTTCHAAPVSDTATDVMLPEIAVCQQCHGGEFAEGKTKTGCTDCHGFHREDLLRADTQSATLRWE